MNFFTILIIGLSGIVGQVILLRELLISFYGNELVLGVVLANWLVVEAIGALLLGRYIDKIRNKLKVFVLLEFFFCASFIYGVFFTRTFKYFLGIPFGESLSIFYVFLISIAVMLPLAFTHGGLFAVCCKLYPVKPAIGRVYAWEAVGTLAGGVMLTYLFTPYFDSFQTAFIIIYLNTFIFISVFRNLSFWLRQLVLLFCILFLLVFIFAVPQYLQKSSVNMQYSPNNVLDYHNSQYGNIVVTKAKEQTTFFHNGIPVITTPYPNYAEIEEFGNFALLFHRAPREVLIIGAGPGGIINEMLKHGLKKVDYLEPDRLFIHQLRKFTSKLVEAEFGDKRVNIIRQDARFFIRNTASKYDVMLVGFTQPSDLAVNRFFTEEFFRLAEARLNPGGLIAFRLPGSLSYISPHLRDLNLSISNGAKNVFDYVRVIPGDYNIYIASNQKDITQLSPEVVNNRIDERQIKTNLLIKPYINYRLDISWQEWFKDASKGGTLKVNRDNMPYAVFQNLILWNKQFSAGAWKYFEWFGHAGVNYIFGVILILVGIWTYFLRKRAMGLSTVYPIFTTGFFGMLVNLVLIFSFQSSYGYLYHQIGLFTGIFMFGIACGSIYITMNLDKIKSKIDTLYKVELYMSIFCLALIVILFTAAPAVVIPYWFYIFLFISSGIFVGLEFPLANSIYLMSKEALGESVGVLYFTDLIGGWLAGIMGGILLLPVLGISKTCLLVFLLKLTSLVHLAISKNFPLTKRSN